MIIDFHTHIFPDIMASGTVKVLKDNIKRQRGYDAKAYADGTLNGLYSSMEENDIDKSIVLPIATLPKHTTTINRFAEGIRNDRVISFASMHPFMEDWEEVIEDIAQRGFLGIKFHPEYQKFDIDSAEGIRAFKKAEELGLIVVYHAGIDVGMPAPVHSTPARLKHLLEYVKGDRIVAAHMGGFEMWDEVEDYIAGTPIYMDTAVASQFMDRDQYKRIIRKHGADKVLFGSDSPWECPKDTLLALESLQLSEEEMNQITHVNAMRLLGL